MMTVKEASRLTGISIRTLQYYDKLGLLPAMRTESGYRLYDDAALERFAADFAVSGAGVSLAGHPHHFGQPEF